MSEATLITLAQSALTITVLLGAPVLVVTLVIGSLVSLVQAATQVNEVTLTFVPKIIAVVAILFFLGGWMSQQILAYTANLYNNLPNLIH